MSDVRQEVAVGFAAAGSLGQIEILARLAARLTLLARYTYDDTGGVANSTKLRAYNEALHRVSGQLLKLVTGDEDRYPDIVFGNILVDQFSILQLDPTQILQSMPPSAGGTTARDPHPPEAGRDRAPPRAGKRDLVKSQL